MAVKKAPTKSSTSAATEPKPSKSASSKKAKTPAPEPFLTALPEETCRDLFGIAKRADRDFGDRLVAALQKIDRGLLPPASTHPYQAHIAAGAAGLDPLLDLIERGSEREWFDALDAVAHIAFALTAPDASAGSTVPREILERLRRQLARPDLGAEQRALVMKTLAIARDEDILQEQLRRLADPDPGVVATAARLLGLGRYRPAARVLRELVSPERFFESRAVLWALGEIGDPSVLPALYRALAQAFRVVDCLIAIGKIGQITSIGEITPMILQGAPEQRDAAYRALAMILDHHRNAGPALAEITGPLKNLIETQLHSDKLQLSGSTRFHMLLCLARMGQTLDPARVRRYLQLGVDDASAVAKVFEKKQSPSGR